MSRKTENYIVLDTETANSLDNPLVYDFGFIVTNRKHEILLEKSFIVSDIFYGEKELMKTAYYNYKVLLYKNMIKHKEIEVINILDLFYYMRRVIKEYNIKEAFTYNASFDLNALNITMRYLTKSLYRYFFPYSLKISCIHHMACQVLFTKTGYLKLALANGWESEKGNVFTNADYCYKYISENLNSTQDHTALSDVILENEILKKCFKQKKKMFRNINRACWRIPQAKYKQLKKG